MDHQKTGALIAARRNELGLTQKALAQKLNISDRAVSRWERGAGFPDISLVEPLADALNLTVLELLHGELSPEPERTACEDIGVRDALRILGRHSKREMGFVGTGLKVGGIMLFWVILLPALVFTLLFYRPADIEVSDTGWTSMDVRFWGKEYTHFEITDETDLDHVAAQINTSHYRKRLRKEAPVSMAADICLRHQTGRYVSITLCDNGNVLLLYNGSAVVEAPASGPLYDHLWELVDPYIT